MLQVAENLTQNIALQVGSLTETVEVQAGASMVETRDSSIAHVIEQQRIVDLPLNGRNLTSLLMLSGVATGTMTLNGGDLTGSKNMGGSNGSGTVLGGRRRSQRLELTCWTAAITTTPSATSTCRFPSPTPYRNSACRPAACPRNTACTPAAWSTS